MRYLMLVALLAGCATAEQRQARVDQMISEMGRACLKIGHAEGSPEHKECVTRLLAAQTGKSDVHVSQQARQQQTCRTIGNVVQCN